MGTGPRHRQAGERTLLLQRERGLEAEAGQHHAAREALQLGRALAAQQAGGEGPQHLDPQVTQLVRLL